MMQIKGFLGEYRFLSNFYPSHITLMDVRYKTAEHAYQASKTLNVNDRLMISKLTTPWEAKKQSRYLELRPDWESVKLDVMHDVVFLKFFQNLHLTEKLIDTGKAYLEETNNWGDTFWGVYNGKGSNHLGTILMAVRYRLKIFNGVMVG